MRKLLVTAVICWGLTMTSMASNVVNPVSWSNDGGTIDYPFDKSIDNSGLSSPLSTGDTVPATLPTHIVPGGDQIFQDVAGRFTGLASGTATLTFDLGETYPLDGCIFWNGAETWAGSYYNGRGVAGMTMSFSTDGVNFSGDVTVAPAIIPDGPDPFGPEVFAISAEARYVRLSVLSNHNDNDAHTAISEIKFTYSTSMAHTPVPANGAILVDSGVQLSWSAPETYTGAMYNIYFGTDEPNELKTNYGLTWLNAASPKQTATTIAPVPSPLDDETTYYWVVDTYEPNTPADMLHPGSYWSFTTAPSIPVITQQPQSATGDPADLYIEATNAQVYEWWKVGIPDELVASPGTIGIPGEPSNTFSTSVEGDYYCIVKNEGGSSDPSAVVRVLTPRLIAHWDFEGDLVPVDDAGDVTSMTGVLKNPNEPASTPTPAFDTGLMGSGQAVDFGSDTDITNYIEIGDPNNLEFIPRGATISAWVKPAIQPPGWTSFVARGGQIWLNANDSDETDWNFMANYQYGPVIKDYGWHQIALTIEGTTYKFYSDGELVSTFTESSGPTDISMIFGASDDTGRGAYYGLLDDVKIFSYVKDPLTIAEDYVAVNTDSQVCVMESGLVSPATLTYDFDGDCDVDLVDFATFAAEWLNCNRVAGSTSGLADCL